MRRPFCLAILLVLLAPASYAQQGGNPADQSRQTSKIPEGEVHFTPEQLQQYYLVYKNADVRYLRMLFDAYLQGASGREQEFQLLDKWNKSYYRSKFVVLSRDKNVFGGTLITIIFEDRPDKVFLAWVYPEGTEKTLTLRAFDLGKFSDEDIKRIQVRYKKLLTDKIHCI
jgi:hypothetical protein